MAFTVLNPDVPQADANAYISVAEFNTHHTDRGVTQVVDGAFETEQIQAAIVKATDYIDKRFGRKFRGYKRTRSQRTEWPRIDAYDNDNYSFDPRPRQLIEATAEYALLALQLGRDLAPVPAVAFPTVDPVTGAVTAQGGGPVTKTTKIVGPIESTTEFAAPQMGVFGAGATPLPEYPQADLWLKELTTNTNSRQLVRG